METSFLTSSGTLGGIISGLVGSGMDIFCCFVMVLLFGLYEKVSTQASVILMAINAVAGFILHKYVIGDFVEPELNYWLAAVPVFVVGVPTGAMLCSLLKRKTIVRIIICLIFIELVFSPYFSKRYWNLLFFGFFVIFHHFITVFIKFKVILRKQKHV